jgi:ribosomal protein L7/L12
VSPNREAERLRIIIESLAFTNPEMHMGEAKDVIFKIEAESFEHESRELPTPGVELRDCHPETLACFVDLVPEIQRYLPDRKINAIKELRTRVIDGSSGMHVGLKDAKDGIEHWVATRTPTVPVHPAAGRTVPASTPGSSSSVPASPAPADVADFIESQPTLLSYGYALHHGTAGYNKINFIKDVRAAGYVGLKEARDGVEELMLRIARGTAPTVT